MTRIRRARLRLSAMLATVVLAGAPAAAQTLSTVLIDPVAPDIELSGGVTGVVVTATQNVIVNDLEATASSALVVLDDSVIGLTESVAPGGTLVFTMDNNFISGIGTGNASINAIGVLPAPGLGGINGAAILSLQVTDTVTLSTVLDGDLVPLDITGTVAGTGDASGSFSTNSVRAQGSFNDALSTIETVSYADLTVPTVSGLFDPSNPVLPDQTASLSVLNVQLNYAFDSTGASGEANVYLDEGDVLFRRFTPAGDTILGGSYVFEGNSVVGEATGNGSDNSVLLRREITYVDDQGTPDDDTDDTEETLTGTLLFEGTAVVSNLQGSGDAIAAGDPDNPGDGVGINSFMNDGTIEFFFQKDPAVLDPGIAIADELSVTATANFIASRAALNVTRNEVFFDGGISLSGVLQDPVGSVVAIAAGAPLGTEADYQVNNVQLAGTLDDPQLHQAASAFAEDSTIGLALEYVQDDTSLVLDGNEIAVEAAGNSALNLVGNGRDQTTLDIDGVAASANFQTIFEPEITSTAVDSTIATFVTSSLETAFGGSSLSVSDNLSYSAATGNRFGSAIRLEALALTLDIDDGLTLNTGASILSDEGTAGDVENYTITAGASTLSYQLLDGDGPDFELDDVSVEGIIEASDFTVIVGSLALIPVEALNGSVTVERNQMLASAVGNSFAGSTELNADSLTGTAGSLAVQRNEAQNVRALSNDSDFTFIFLTPLEDSNFNLSIAENALLALASSNEASTAVFAAAGSFIGGADDTAVNAEVLGSDDTTDFVVPQRNSVAGRASLLIVSDQGSFEGDAAARVQEGQVIAALTGTPGAIYGNLALDVVDNTIAAQARINDAANAIQLFSAADAPALSVTTAGSGAIAGIVSQQVSTHDAPGDPPPLDPAPGDSPLNGAGAVAVAEVFDSAVNAFALPSLQSSAMTIAGNRILADAAANAVFNQIAVDALTIDQVDPSASGSQLSTAPSDGLDVDLLVEDAGFFIANSQRNEARVPASTGDPTTPDSLGPAVVVRFGRVDDGNSFAVAASAVIDSAIGASGNALVGSGAANRANNSIALSLLNGETNAGILSNQVNSGDVTVTNTGSTMSFIVFSESTDSSLALEGNQIGAFASGSEARNSIAASANSFSGVTTAATGASITPSGSVLNAQPSAANGNLVILNAQTSYGIGGGGPAEMTEIAAGVDGSLPIIGPGDPPVGSLLLYVPGDTTGSSVSVSGNVIIAEAAANTATNSVTALSSTGGLPSATILNQQQASGTAVSGSVSGVTVLAQLGDATLGTAVSDSRVSVSGNQIGSGATINNASNAIGSPGQVFTRTSSF